VKLVVDTNIVFSGILNSSSQIGKILIGSRNEHQLYSCYYLKEELEIHRDKLERLTGLSKEEVIDLQEVACSNITFISEENISSNSFLKAEELLSKSDQKDILFVALAIELDATLWTGDKKLMNALQKGQFIKHVTTSSLALNQ